ncbi:tetrahydromethanopterin S-methyltransferase subunit C [Microbacterium sp. AK009]|uniref:PLDc N-terminal domain-containing protein n=1 Tax=Microbacterium sp. AK009 TaxID=2723068 RepID=UPI0017C36FC7|nr:PLDc N-terminal domain-containing protein [Microbacterium sp. AK009]NYF17264.1 tetrahydromethanopterin S-methyltransferase subunit C [Microbacterium sp. AK009]
MITPSEPSDRSAVLSGAAKGAAAATTAAPVVRTALGLLGVVQAAFAFLAFWDLAHRDSRQVTGPKPVWIPVILVNWIGPAAYFLFGIKR